MVSRYNVVDFEQKVFTRMKNEHVDDIKKIVKKDDETYNNFSHFIRVAVIRHIRAEQKRLFSNEPRVDFRKVKRK